MIKVGGTRRIGIWSRTFISGGSAPFDPAELFAAGESGYWFDASDFSTMFQNSAGTTPVTAVGQPVGMIQDKSGNGQHFIQETDAARPILRQDAQGFYYLEFNGTDSNLSRASVSIGTGKTKATAFYAHKYDALPGTVTLHTTGGEQEAGVFYTRVNSSGNALLSVNGSNFVTQRYDGISTNKQLCVRMLDVSANNLPAADASKARFNGASVSLVNISAANIGTAFAFVNNTTHQLGASGSAQRMNGRIYQVIVRYSESTAEEIESTEAWVNERFGAY